MKGAKTVRGPCLAAGAVLAALGALALSSGLRPARVTVPVVHPAPVAQELSTPSSSTGALRRELDVRRETAVTADVEPGSLRVEVVEPGGEPAAGVWVVCGRSSPTDPKVFEALARSCTDASGSAWIALSEGGTLEDARPSAWPDEPLRLRAEILAQPSPEVVLDPAAPPGSVLLRLPPTGSVLLEACDARGSVTSEPVRFGVWVRPESGMDDLSPLPLWLAAPRGVAVLPRVGLGLAVRVVADPQLEGASEGHAQTEGPGFQGEQRRISVPLGDPWPSVCLRAVDEKGQALRNEELEAVVHWRRPATALPGASDASLALRVRTDQEGRACFTVRGTVAGGYERGLVLTRVVDAAKEGRASTYRSAEHDLSWDWSGTLELGVVLLEQRDEALEVPWVSGTVVDATGMPVQGATVLVTPTDADGAPVRGPVAQAAVDENGAFTAVGAPSAALLAVRAQAPGFLLSSEQEVVPGTSLSIRMQPAACWKGRVLLDPDVPPASLVVVVSNGEDRRQIALSSEHVVMENLEGDSVDVEVRVREGNWLVERWPGLSTSAAAAHPAEEHVLDLRGRLTPLRLRLVGVDGRALDRVRAHVRPEPWPEGSTWVRAGRLDLVVPADSATITVEPRGYRAFAVEPLAGIQELAVGR